MIVWLVRFVESLESLASDEMAKKEKERDRKAGRRCRS